MKIFKAVAQNWRELIGWITIGVFVYINSFNINFLGLSYPYDSDSRRLMFYVSLVITVFVLGWLKFNKK